MSDAERLAGYVSVWWEAIDAFTHLLEQVPADQWSMPTDLPGWDVRAVAAHTAHLEALLGGRPHDDVEIGDAPHAHGMMGQFTEQGVVARRNDTPDQLITEIREATTARHTALLADPPTDPTASAPGLFGAIGWTTERLLRNRPLDVFMHEQDVRRAVGLPETIDSPQAIHSATYLLESFPFVLGKRAQAPAGTSARLSVHGHDPVTAVVGEDGRARPSDIDGEPAVGLTMDRATFLVLSGGRRRATPGAVEITGDAALGAQILDAMGVTP
jgi:uncharacterized protein (TIGR03083 family)